MSLKWASLNAQKIKPSHSNLLKSERLWLFLQNKYCKENMFNSHQDQLQVPGESTRDWGNGVLKYLSERCIFS